MKLGKRMEAMMMALTTAATIIGSAGTTFSVNECMNFEFYHHNYAVIENFLGLLKSELLYLQEFQSMEHFNQELIEYLDYYNNRRMKEKLKGLPPAIYR